MRHAKAAAAAAPEVASYHYNLGQLLAQSRQLEEAQRSLERTLDLAPEHATALNELGRVYLELGLLPEARAVLSRGIASEQATGRELAPLLKNLGRVALAEEHTEEARRLFTDALSHARRNHLKSVISESLFGLARVELVADRRTVACSWLAELWQHDPETARIALQEDGYLRSLVDCDFPAR